MDFTEPKEYIGGTDGWILAIRDLTSGDQLAWLSFAQATAECVVGVLRGLFIEHGPPLVLKSDNGSQFIADLTLELLRGWRVEPLFHPPRRPAYNGGLERTHPILKSDTLAAAAAQGRPTGILPEDLQTGRANANRFTRRLGSDGPTAEEAWRTREPITEEQRAAFRRSVQDRRPAARASRGLSEDAELNHHQRAAVGRTGAIAWLARLVGRSSPVYGCLLVRFGRQGAGGGGSACAGGVIGLLGDGSAPRL